MKLIPTSLFLLSFLASVSGCSDSDPLVEAEPEIDVPSFSSGLDSERLLSSLSDEEISSACQPLSAVVTKADAEIACRVVAAGEANDSMACAQRIRECLPEPASALSQTSLRSTPGEIDCDDFTADLVTGCDFPVSLLEDCVNALAQSVVPAAESVGCGAADEFSDVDEAQANANEYRDTSFVTVCFDLLECSELVAVLLGEN